MRPTWALGFALLLVVLFALGVGYHIGNGVADHLFGPLDHGGVPTQQYPGWTTP